MRYREVHCDSCYQEKWLLNVGLILIVIYLKRLPRFFITTPEEVNNDAF